MSKPDQSHPPAEATTQCIDWYHEGQSRTVVVGDVNVTVRFVGRDGRRARVAITAPAGAIFRSDQERKACPKK